MAMTGRPLCVGLHVAQLARGMLHIITDCKMSHVTFHEAGMYTCLLLVCNTTP